MSIARNTTVMLAGSVVPLAVSLVSIPFYLAAIGLERFGVLSIAWLFLGYFGLTDLGLGRATAQSIAAARERTLEERSRIFWTALVINLGLGVIGGLLLCAALYGGGHLIKFGDQEIRTEFFAAIPLLALILPFATSSGVLRGALQGRESFLALMVLGNLNAVLGALLPLGCAIWVSPSLPWLVAAALTARLVVAFATLWICARTLPLAWPELPNRQIAGSLFRFGGWVTVTSCVGPLLAGFDRFAIGTVSGTAAVSFYSIPQNLLSRVTIIPSSLSEAIFPRSAAAKNLVANHLILNKSVSWLLFIMTPIAVGLLFIVEPFLIFWLGKGFADVAAPVAHILVAGVWVNSLARPAYAVLQGRGRPDLVAKTHLAELVPYALVLFVALHVAGIQGAAVAWATRCFADALILCSLANLSMDRFRQGILAGSLVTATTVTVIIFPVESLGRWFALGLAAAACALWCVTNRPPEFLEQLMRLRAIGNFGRAKRSEIPEPGL